jgi:hypothetical protein
VAVLRAGIIAGGDSDFPDGSWISRGITQWTT